MKNQKKNHTRFLKVGICLFLLGVSKLGFCSPSENLPESRVHIGMNVDLKDINDSDMTVIGSHVTLETDVSGDFNALGENILITSPIQGDFEVIGNRVTIHSRIEGDAQIFASKVKFMPNSLVGGQTKIVAQKVFLQGTLSGDSLIKARKVYINGVVDGTLTLNAHKIIIGNHALLKQGFSYPKGSSLIISKTAKILGETTFFEPKQGDITDFEEIFEDGLSGKVIHFFEDVMAKGVKKYWDFSPTIGSLSLFFFVWIVAMGCLFLFYRATPLIFQNLTEMALKNPGRSLGIGLAGLVLIPFFSILLCLTLVGIPFAFLMILFYCALLFLGKIMGIWIFGQWLILFTPLKKKISFGRDILMFTVSLVIVSFLSLIPLFGWLFATLIFLMGFGSILGVMFFREGSHVLYVQRLGSSFRQE